MPGLLEGVAGGGDRRGEHPDRVVGPHAQVVDAGPRREAVVLQALLVDDEQRGGGVGDLRGDRGGDAAALLERGQRADLLPVRLARALVVLDARRAARSRASKRPSARARMARSWLSTANASISSREQSHFSAIISALLNWLTSPVAVALHPALGAGERVVEAEVAGEGHRRADRDHRHLLHAAGDDHVVHAGHHRLGGEVDGLLGRAALPVDGRAGHVLGEVGGQPAGAGDVAGLPADGVDAAVDHVLDRARVDAGAGHRARAAGGRRGRPGGPGSARRPAARPGVRTASTMKASGMRAAPTVSRWRPGSRGLGAMRSRCQAASPWVRARVQVRLR